MDAPQNSAQAGGLTAVERGLWLRMRGDGDSRARDELLRLHTPYARVVAASYYGRRYHDEIPFDDYLQLASVGLLEAMERFDLDAGVQFRTFAARRMHGAILNGLETMTEKQQQIAARQRLDAQRRTAVAGMSLEAAAQGVQARGARAGEQALRVVAEAGLAFALEWLMQGTGMLRGAEPAVQQPFYRAAEVRELRDRILALVRGLASQERYVIERHYLQEMSFEDIAAGLGVTRSRVSQIHRQALLRLRAEMADEPTLSLSV